MIKKRFVPFKVLLTTAALTVAMGSGNIYADELLNGFIIRDDVQARYTAQKDGAVTGILNMNSITSIKDVYGDWVLIQEGDISGWVNNQNLFIKTETNKLVSFGRVNATILNVRQEPSLGAPIIGKLSMGDDVFITNISEDWFYVKNDLIEGWVFAPYVNVTLQDKKGKVLLNDEVVEVNRGNITSRENLVTSEENTEEAPVIKIEGDVKILDFKEGEYYIKDQKDVYAWVDAQGVEITQTLVENAQNNNEIVQISKEHLGKPYKWGANGPNSFDCSGLTRYVYSQVGIQLPRVSRDQAKVGQAVSRSDLIAGDLIFFDTSGSMNNVITHVGIYIGNNEFIHASSSRSGKSVIISTLNSFYSSRFVSARRVK